MVAPKLAALEQQQNVTAALLKETADTVATMRREDEFAERLAAELRRRRWQALTGVEKTVLLLLAFVPLATLVLAAVGAVHP